LRERLKLAVEQVDVFSLVGSRFQALGAATEKAFSACLYCENSINSQKLSVWHQNGDSTKQIGINKPYSCAAS